jgi:CBS domain-containing protein
MDTRKTIKDALGINTATVSVDDTLHDALKLLGQYNATALLVAAGNDTVGIITISDIMYSLAKDEDPQKIPVSSFMTQCELISTETANTPCVQLDEDEEIFSAIKVMNEAGVNHVLVSGNGGKPVGMVSSLDIIKVLVA